MKKLYALLLIVAILLAFAGCSKKGTANVDVDASSETVVGAGDVVNSDVMPDVESKAGDIVIDINELFEDSASSSAKTGNSTSTSQTNYSSKGSAESSSKSGSSSITSSISNVTSSTASNAGASLVAGETDSGTGYTSGWAY